MNYLIQGLVLLVGIFIGAFIVAITFINNQISIDQDTIIAASATFIAACAFWVTYIQTMSSRKHNELMLTPRIGVQTADYTNLDNDDLFDITVLNNGLGPAEIKDAYVEFFYDGNTYTYTLNTDGLSQYITRVFTDYPRPDEPQPEQIKRLLLNLSKTQRVYRETYSFSQDELIAAQTEKKFIYLRLPTTKDKVLLTEEQKEFMIKAARYALRNTRIVIKYQSLLGKKDVFEDKITTLKH